MFVYTLGGGGVSFNIVERRLAEDRVTRQLSLFQPAGQRIASGQVTRYESSTISHRSARYSAELCV